MICYCVEICGIGSRMFLILVLVMYDLVVLDGFCVFVMFGKNRFLF